MLVTCISDIIRLQQVKSDKLYRNAIQANYCHENNTPLNNILNNSKILLKLLENLSKNLYTFDKE